MTFNFILVGTITCTSQGPLTIDRCIQYLCPMPNRKFK